MIRLIIASVSFHPVFDLQRPKAIMPVSMRSASRMVENYLLAEVTGKGCKIRMCRDMDASSVRLAGSLRVTTAAHLGRIAIKNDLRLVHLGPDDSTSSNYPISSAVYISSLN